MLTGAGWFAYFLAVSRAWCNAESPVRIVEQTFLKPGRYRVGGELREYDAGHLGDFCNGTREVLAAGHSIPLFYCHRPLGAIDGGPVADPGKATADTIGWLRGIDQQPDGALRATIEVTDPAAGEKIGNGSIRFTSPELSPTYTDGHGREFHNVIRHMALTSVPRTPDQSEFSDAKSGASQFSLDDYQGPVMKKKKLSHAESEVARTIGGAQFQDDDDEKKKDTPPEDMGKDDSDAEEGSGPDTASVVQQVIERLGVEIPDGVDPMSEMGLILVMTAILNKTATEEPSESAAIEEITPGVAQFAEHADPTVRALADMVQSLQAGRYDDMAATARGKLLARIEGASVPPITKKRLRALYAGVQFADGEPARQFSLDQVIGIVIDSIPRSIQFGETDVVEEPTATHPDGNKFHKTTASGVSTEDSESEAEEIYDRGKEGRWSRQRPAPMTTQPDLEMGPAVKQPEVSQPRQPRRPRQTAAAK